MAGVSHILEAIAVAGLVAALALVATRGLDRLLGVSERSRPRHPTVFLARARAVLPAVRALIWLGAGLLVLALLLGRKLGTAGLALVLPLLLAVAWGLKDHLSNAVAGFVLAVDRPFQVGDRIVVGDVRGTVTGLGLGQTRLTTDAGRQIRVPNRILIADGYRTATGLQDVAVEVTLALPDGLELSHGKRLAFRSAVISRYASPRRKPEVFVEILGDVRLRVRAYACDPTQLEAYKSEITEIWLETLSGAR